MKYKHYTHQSLIGQQGVNIIEKIVLQMGYVWNPTNLDAGIDGTIEIRDSESGRATNFILQVQSKASKAGFKGEDEYKFDYYCNDNDLDYWMQGNCPVLLICVNVDKEEAYWVSVKEYFKDLSKLKSKKVTFDKRRNLFDVSAKEQISTLSIPEDSGFYFTPPKKSEKLHSNVLKLVSYPNTIFCAKTDYRDSKELWEDLNNLENHYGINKAWILKEGLIYTVNDLHNYPWTEIHKGSIKSFPSNDWSQSHDLPVMRDFVQLLNATFDTFAYRKSLIRKKTKQFDLYYFKPQLDLQDYPKTTKLNYNRLGRKSFQTICNRYMRKSDPTVISYFRHFAFERQFHKFENDWYLEINPTYLFTHNGFKVHTYYESKLKGKKGLDKAETVFSQILFWTEILLRTEPMFGKPILEIKRLNPFDIDRSIDDELWLKKEDKATQAILKSETGLFT